MKHIKMTEELSRKVKGRELADIKIKKLKFNPLNPPERLCTSVSLILLKNKVREYGVINPVHFC